MQLPDINSREKYLQDMKVFFSDHKHVQHTQTKYKYLQTNTNIHRFKNKSIEMQKLDNYTKINMVLERNSKSKRTRSIKI